jgi:RNA polymerase sigma factor (sigma-70 family)
LKRTPPEKILEAIRDAHAGGVPLNPQMAAKVAKYFQQIDEATDELNSLTPRERQTLELLAEGYLYKEIADRLGVSPGTVHQFSKQIYEKLHVRSRTEAVVKFLRR